ncbi:hypothetical protein GN244_ATG09038 [Phytophthora infestans]|uniref:Uncharacterized protein n=1 Tax=Phytophthora infestans TaxID=4787 RepID=A0A833T3V9_PHYIN|nr:hypothetical protein GN244_ATG09038 [Phytophthora infestans]KAF4132544.1 hypothetical protein GN958_ATG18274 [Phytophthora infestans]
MIIHHPTLKLQCPSPTNYEEDVDGFTFLAMTQRSTSLKLVDVPYLDSYYSSICEVNDQRELKFGCQESKSGPKMY